MARTPDPYSRVYWRIVDDERFADIYGNDGHLAAWLRLLICADQAWPASAHLPTTVRRASVTALVGCGLVELRPGGLYRVHGLDAERERRSSVGNAGASARWNERNANAMRTHSERNAIGMLDETSIDKTRRDEPDPPWLTAWLSVKMRLPTIRQLDVIEAYVRTFDVSGPERAARLILGHPDDPLGALMADLKAFREQAKGEAVVQEQEAVARRKAERRGFAKGSVEYELAQMLYAKETG